MSPRPKNPPPDRRQELLEAALRVFSRRGYVAATNAEIAREAGVTAAALYYYFPSKADLFRAVLTEHQAQIVPAVQQLNDQLMELDPRMVIPFLVQNLVGFMTQERTRQIISIMLAEAPRNTELGEIWQAHVIGRMVPLVLGYVMHQMEKGTIRKVDPRLLMLTLAGPVLTTVFTRDLMQVPLMQDITNEDLVRQLTETILDGLMPKE